ncbi:hypothetical protein KAU32_12490 [bacterium]|nr:hypothetical protein [bacterium]
MTFLNETGQMFAQFKFILPVVLVLAGLFALSLMTAISGFKKKHYLKGLVRATSSLLILLILFVIAGLCTTLLKYRILSRKFPVATLKITPIPGGFVYNHYSKDKNIPSFHRKFKGERFMVEGLFIDFKEGLEIIGLKPIFQLTAVRSTDDNGSVIEELLFHEDLKRIKYLAKNFEKLFVFEKVYFSAASQYKREDDAYWELKYSTDALFLQLND